MRNYIPKYLIVSVLLSLCIVASIFFYVRNADQEFTDNADQKARVMRSVAQIESLDLLVLESFPVQVRAAVKGFLPDSCTYIDQINTRKEDKKFIISVQTVREIEALCTQVVMPFEETVALDVLGLDKGVYVVEAGDQSSLFTLEVKNELILE